jgi:hypothetical protein
MRNRRNITPPRNGASISDAIKIAIMPRQLMLRVRTWGRLLTTGVKSQKSTDRFGHFAGLTQP